jgi:phage terminase large subunit-like protein
MMHATTQYALDVVEGRRAAGMPERQACARHLADLKRAAEDPSFAYIFDEGRADKIFTWFSYCKHVEGPRAGQPIELEPFQQFDLGCIFGWVKHETGRRRFEKAYIQEARKNGKSTIMSGLALYLMCGDSEESPSVYCAAVDREQARIVYKAAKAMAQKSPDIQKRLKIRDYMISHVSRGGELKALSADMHNKDGLNPSGAIIDEYHAHQTSEIYDLLWSAWGQRAQALMVIITTAGFETNENPCFKEYEYCKDVLRGITNNDQYFVSIRELDPNDDEHDPKNWIKANPLRAATPAGLARLQEQHDEAFGSRDPAKVRNFRVKNLNRFVNETEDSYMGDLLPKWRELGVSREAFLEMTRGRKCIAGCDLSKKIDLTADAFLFALDDGRVAICATGFMPEEAVKRHEKTDKVEYRDWQKSGWLTVTEGDVTDYDAIKTHLHDVELNHGWQIHEFSFDPYNATHLANDLQKDGYTIVEARQGVRTLSEPTKLLREMISQGKVVHDGSPLLTWCLGNAKTEQDNNENVKLSKKNASDTRRIDLASAVVNAMVRLQALREACVDLNQAILNGKWGM